MTSGDGADGIASDTKDWTWVLERPCGDCGFDSSAVGHDDVGARLRLSRPRRGLRSNGSEFTIATTAVYHLHDVVHHAWDVRTA